MTYQAYVDKEYYTETFKGTAIDDASIDNALIEASHDIDSLTYNRIVRDGFGNLTPFQQDIIKRSVCLHADFSNAYGELFESPIAGYSAGTTSVNYDMKNIVKNNGVSTSARIYALLKQTGLMVGLFI